MIRYSKRSNPRKKRASKKRDRAFQVQEFLLDRDTFTPARARDWLRKHGHRTDGISESDTYIHAVQHPRDQYQHRSLHNVGIAPHVDAVVGIPQEDSPAARYKGYNRRGPRQQRLRLAPRGALDMGTEPTGEIPF